MILLTLYDVVSLPFKSKHLPFVEMAAGTCLIDKVWPTVMVRLLNDFMIEDVGR